MKVERFEDLIAWQKARKLAGEIHRLSGTGEFARDFALKDQIRRAAISIPSNIAEGFERRTSREFLQFLSVAKSSCAELRTQLYLALDAGYLERVTFDSVIRAAEEVSKILGALRPSIARRVAAE